VILRGEIDFVNLDPVIGHEQSGQRPVLVLSTDDINSKPLVVTVVPGTDGANEPRDFPTTIRVPAADSGLPRETVFLCFQVRALDHSRFTSPPAGRLSDAWMQRVGAVVRRCLGL
jgi:mRNA interferase MazF